MKRTIIASLAVTGFIALALIGCGQQSSPPPPPRPRLPRRRHRPRQRLLRAPLRQHPDSLPSKSHST